MDILVNFSFVPEIMQDTVWAMGNFDGIHMGHQEVISQAKAIAKSLNKDFGIITFEPHPKDVILAKGERFRLTPRDTRRRILSAMGINKLIEIPFDMEFCNTSPHYFVENYLVKKLNIAALITGEDFRFGKQKSGNKELLTSLADEFNFVYKYVDLQVSIDGNKISATQIRQLLKEGKPEMAEHLLGRPFVMEGLVFHGKSLARTFGFPTANFRPKEFIRPKLGVYLGYVKLENSDYGYPAITNIGRRPTVDGIHRVICEAHLIDWHGDLYGKNIHFSLKSFLRNEQKFDSIDGLKIQIAKDVKQAKDYFNNLK